MTLKTTRWSPDTCTCSVDYSWDDSLGDSERIHNLSKVIQRCPAHQALSDDDTFSSLMDENPRKNISLAHCLEHGPPALFDTIDGTKQLKGNLSFNRSWSGTAPNRILTISFTGINLTTQQKNGLQTALNARFGGKVLIA